VLVEVLAEELVDSHPAADAVVAVVAVVVVAVVVVAVVVVAVAADE